MPIGDTCEISAVWIAGELRVQRRVIEALLEKDLIAKALEETGGNVTRAAKLLQISRKSLQTKMKEFGLRDEGGVAEES